MLCVSCLLLLRVVEWLLLMLLLVSSAHESNLLMLMCILKVVWTTHDLMVTSLPDVAKVRK
jgi:hypothetical protein